MARRLTPLSQEDAARALADRATNERTLVKHFLALLQEIAPGSSVEVRIPPYVAAQVIPGVRHTRGTPPAVVEMDGPTWIGLALGELDWNDMVESGRVVASGERTDLTVYLPLE